MTLTYVQPGDKPRAADQNAIVDELRALQQRLLSSGLTSNSQPWWGLITTEGPNAEDDYDDNRYWVKRALTTNSDGDKTTATEFAAVDKDVNAYALWITATNSAEALSESHLLPEDTPVLIFTTYDKSDTTITRYVFDSAPVVGALFVVNLNMVGGSDGSNTTAPTWTYDVTTLTGTDPIASAATPSRTRIPGSYTAASMGYAYYDNTGTAILAEAWETPNTETCG